MSIEEYADLATTGFQGGAGEKKTPEEEFFHSVYIAGAKRKNHINIVEERDKFQIRGVQYNLEEINMVITHVKEVLVNVKTENKKESLVCFSFKEGAPPWYGTTKLSDGSQRQCPQTSPERAVNDFCNPCRAQIIVAGIYCKADGSPILSEDNKPIFIFIRGKGTKYPNVSTYLNDRYQEDLSPIFEPVTDQSKEFEKSVVNNKRFVTTLIKGTATTGHGNEVNVFVLDKGVELPKESVLDILKLSKKTVKQFNEKFDWSKGKHTSKGSSKSTPNGVLTMDENESSNQSSETKAEEAGVTGKKFSFDDVEF